MQPESPMSTAPHEHRWTACGRLGLVSDHIGQHDAMPPAPMVGDALRSLCLAFEYQHSQDDDPDPQVGPATLGQLVAGAMANAYAGLDFAHRTTDRAKADAVLAYAMTCLKQARALLSGSYGSMP